MTTNEIKDACHFEINSLIEKAFFIGKNEGQKESCKAVDRFEEGFIAGGIALKDALLDDDFLMENYKHMGIEDVLMDFSVGVILESYKQFVEKQKKIGEGWTQLETSTNNHRIRAKCHNCGYLMNWEDRTKYCPECGSHNREE